MNQIIKKLMTGVLISVLSVSMFGCSNSNTSNNGKDDATSVERPYYVKDVDEVTGKLTCYTTMEETQQEVVRELWNKYYPNCELELQADSVGTLATRIRSDESTDCDVLLGGQFAADGDMYHDILRPYTAACDDEQLYHDEAGYITYYDVQVMCLCVNEELEQELGLDIQGYEDLLDPALEGKIILAAPDSTSSGWRQLQTILATMGDSFNDEKSWEYIEKLIPSTFSTTSSKDVFNLVSNGEYVVGLSYESSVAAIIKDGAPIRIVYMEEGNTAMPGGVAIVKSAPNPTAAEAMVDLISSAEFQDARDQASAGRPSNGKAELFDLPDQEDLNIVELDYDYLQKNREDIINRWNELYTELT